MDLISQLLHLKTADIEIPDAGPGDPRHRLNPDEPLVNIRNASVRYTDNLVFEHLDWRIEAGQHWQLTGPNGSGKTSLLNLITGDHPQCYNNDIFVFGYQRGNGESIWDIKQHIGYVSSALQWDYRVSINCKNVIISGFYDSIGLYTKATDLQTGDRIAVAAGPGFPATRHTGLQPVFLWRPALVADRPCDGKTPAFIDSG